MTLRSGRLFTMTVEYTTAWLEVEQSGRIVGGSARGRTHDSMLSFLAGVEMGRGRTRTQVLGGVSQLLDTPTSNGDPIDDVEGDPRRQVLTAGLDVVHALNARTSLLVTTRAYIDVDRTTAQQQVGLGRQIYRLGAGVRFGF